MPVTGNGPAGASLPARKRGGAGVLLAIGAAGWLAFVAAVANEMVTAAAALRPHAERAASLHAATLPLRHLD